MGNEWEGNNGNNGSAVALAEGRIGTKSNCKIAKAYCLATQSRSIWTIGRWTPNLRGHDPQGVILRGEQISLIFRISMCYTLIRRGELEGALRFQESGGP